MCLLITITKLVLLSELIKRGGDKPIPIDEIEIVVTRILPSATPVVANESPYQANKEIELAVMQLNYYFRKTKGYKCIEIDNSNISIKKECLGDLRELYKRIISSAERSDTLLSTYIRLIRPILIAA